MGLVLALDTSTLSMSAALVDVEGPGARRRLLEQVDEGPPKKQSELLPGVLGDLLKRHGVELKQLQGFAVGLGPGSFTGLRVGLSCIKALAYAAQKPVGKVSSLAALAWDGPECLELVPCTSARHGELYVGHYRRQDGALAKLSEEDACTTEQLAERLKAHPALHVLGAGLAAEGEKLLAAGVPASQILRFPVAPSGLAVATLAEVPASYEASVVFALEPHYLRASEPERNPKFPPLPGPPPTPRLKD